ncbi:MAG: lysophospholipid acyltransferase family protein [Nitrospirae bacterium]|nr:lysophospholipid acyltransferase family protein [Nitrospirota bacterium]
MRNVLWLLQMGLLYAVTFPVAVLPLRLALGVGSLIGKMGFSVWGSRRRIAVDNISHAIRAGFIDNSVSATELAKEHFRNLGMSAVEIARIYHGFGSRILDRIEVEGIDNYQRAREKGKGILLITGHCGNWELLALAISCKVSPVGAVARPINNPYLNALIERVRKRYGNTVIYKKGALRAIISQLRKGGTVGVLIDQSVLPAEGVVIEFLGRPAWAIKSPSLIARKTGASVVPVFIRRRDNGSHVVEIHPEVELSDAKELEKAVLEDTKRFTSFVEGYIMKNPAEWLWIHRRWKRI